MQYSPLLSVVTGILELAAGAWSFLDRRTGRIGILRPLGLIFFLLAGYQFAEVAVCAGPEKKIWTQLAFLDITWLPPLGLWLAARLSAPRNRWLKAAADVDFGLAAVFSVWIMADPQAITKSVCGLVIARYFPIETFDFTYALFYQLSLLVTILGASAGMALGEDLVLRKHLANLQIGLLGFLLPALAVRILIPEAGEGIMPSVMCHFAIVLAASLLMLALRERRSFPA
jgi:hypothetical protein